MGDSEARTYGTSGAYWHRNTHKAERFVLSSALVVDYRYHHPGLAGDVVRQRYEPKEVERRGRCLRRGEG